MGCTAVDRSIFTFNNNDLVLLVVCDRTDDIIEKIKRLGPDFNPNASLNFNGDTLLHYSCARCNHKLVEYLTSRDDILFNIKNKNK